MDEGSTFKEGFYALQSNLKCKGEPAAKAEEARTIWSGPPQLSRKGTIG